MTVLALSYKAYSDYYATGVILVGTLYMLYGYLKMVGNSLFNLAAYFGLFQGLSVYLTILVSGFGVKQILAFVRS